MPREGYRKPGRKAQRIDVPVSDEVAIRLEDAAKAQGVKKTELARQLLEAGLTQLEAAA